MWQVSLFVALVDKQTKCKTQSIWIKTEFLLSSEISSFSLFFYLWKSVLDLKWLLKIQQPYHFLSPNFQSTQTKNLPKI